MGKESPGISHEENLVVCTDTAASHDDQGS